MTPALILMLLSGGVLIAGSFLKAIHTRPLVPVAEAFGLGRLPAWVGRPMLAGLIGIQAAGGTGLLVGLWPQALPAAALALSVSLAVAAGLAQRAGHIQDCGCYGVFPILTGKITLALDAVLVASLAAMVAIGRPDWRVEEAGLVSLGMGAAAMGLSLLSLRRGPLVPIGAVRIGRRWNSSWSAGVDPGDGLVVLASPRCGVCQGWLKVLKARVALGHFLPVTLVTPEPIEGMPFPVIRIEPADFAGLVSVVPVAARIEDGAITHTWSTMPEDWVAPLRAARTAPVG